MTLPTERPSWPHGSSAGRVTRRVAGEAAERGVAAARDILESHRRELADLTAALVTEETIQGVDLERLLAGVSPYVRGKSKVGTTNGTGGGLRKAASRSTRKAVGEG